MLDECKLLVRPSLVCKTDLCEKKDPKRFLAPDACDSRFTCAPLDNLTRSHDGAIFRCREESFTWS